MPKKYNHLTPKQSLTLYNIKKYLDDNGVPPTLEELKDLIGVKYKKSVVQFLDTLEEKGYIARSPHTHRGIRLLGQVEDLPNLIRVRLIGSAGCDNAEIFAEENYDDSVLVEKSFVPPNTEPSEIVAIRAIGSSMESAGISDGDQVLVDMTENIRSGDRVVAIVGESAVIKRIKFNDNSVVLNPDSPHDGYKPIILKERPPIVGRVLAVIDTQPDDVEVVYDDHNY